jgi:hypothetical protein
MMSGTDPPEDGAPSLSFSDDFLRIVRSTTSCSFDKFTIRVDMFRTIVPALANVEPAVLGLKLRRTELDRLVRSLELFRLPSSAFARSSPSRDIPDGLTFENLTLLLLLLCPVGVP